MTKKILAIFPLLIISVLLSISVIAGLPLASDFNLEDLKNNKVSLKDFKNKIIILDFWATWCPPCREEIPDFIALYNIFKIKGVEIIGISLDRSRDKVYSFVKLNNVNYPILFGNSKVSTDYGGIRAIPTTFIINQKGEIVKKYVGFQKKTVFEKEINRLLEKKN
jgi:cytochrome c biogenesis protein CcmG/thiol:disulfide interchange protein DsbE